MPRRIALIATSLALAVVLVGCGSDDDSADDGDTTTTTEEASSTTEAESAPDAETTDPESTESTGSTETTEAPDETTTPAGSGEGDPEFCAAYSAFDEAADELPDETVEDVKAGVEVLRTGIADLQPLAPEDLADDVDLLIEATEQLSDAVADVTTVEEAEAALGEVFENQEFATAAETVDTYFDENCAEANDDQADAGGAETPETVTPG